MRAEIDWEHASPKHASHSCVRIQPTLWRDVVSGSRPTEQTKSIETFDECTKTNPTHMVFDDNHELPKFDRVSFADSSFLKGHLSLLIETS